MGFIPGDKNKASLNARGLSFEMIIEAIAENGIAEIYEPEKYPGQIVICRGDRRIHALRAM